jgi:PAS domain-containing protein
LQPATTKSHSLLAADIIIANAPDPVFVSDLEGRIFQADDAVSHLLGFRQVFVSDLEGKILQANDAVSQLLGFRQDEVLEQFLSRFISPAGNNPYPE